MYNRQRAIRSSAENKNREDRNESANRIWRYLALPVSFAGMLSIGSAAELNPAAVVYKLPDQIPWSPVDARGAQSAVVVGDPSKPGFYMVYNKWTKGNHFSRPHFHPNDRYIVVLQGTWWVGYGTEIRSRARHGADAGRQLRHPLRQAGALGRRQGRGRRAPDHGRRPGDRDGGPGGKVAALNAATPTACGGNSVPERAFESRMTKSAMRDGTATIAVWPVCGLALTPLV